MTGPTHFGVAIMGATATGKSSIAIFITEKFGGEIISMDSRQVYRGLDIGTAKVSSSERRRVPHHLIDVLDPSVPNSAGWHASQVEGAITAIQARGRLPVLAGGTGLYFRALFEGLIEASAPRDELGAVRSSMDHRTTDDLFEELRRIDPSRASQISPRDRARITRALEIHRVTGRKPSEHFSRQATRHWTGLKIVLTFPRAELRDRIAKRTRSMFERGWIEEVRGLLDQGVTLSDPAMNSLGYRTLAEALLCGSDPRDCIDEVITQTQQYAKRQETFFRSVPGALWVDMSRSDAQATIEQEVSAFL